MPTRPDISAALVFGLTFIAVLVIALALMNWPKSASLTLAHKTYNDTPRNSEPMGSKTHLFSRDHYNIQTDDGTMRPLDYYWFAPEKTENLPLVVVLHGTPGNAYGAKLLVDEPYRSKYPAFILVPVLPQEDTWSYPASEKSAGQRERIGDVAKLITNLTDKFSIDRKRVYVVGCSEGGYGAFGAALNHSELFAAAAAISGGWDKEDAQGLTNIPLRVIHGRLDKNVLPERSRLVAQAIEKAGGKILYIEKSDMGHECPSWRLYNDELWSWLFSQHK